MLKFFVCWITVGALSQVRAASWNEPEDEADERLIVLPITGTGIKPLNLNLTGLAGLAALLASLVITALGLAAIGFLTWAIVATVKYKKHSGYGDYGYDNDGYGGGHGSSYGSYRALDSMWLDWDKLSIVELLSLGQEVYRDFDPNDLECQQKVICEMHQRKNELGPLIEKAVDWFGYIKYLEYLSLPEEVKALADEYIEAADRGKTMKKDCGDIFTTCPFSLKKLVDKYSNDTQNEIA